MEYASSMEMPAVFGITSVATGTDRENQLPLSKCMPGEVVTVERLKGRNETQARLESVGVYPGQRLTVFRIGRRSAMIVDSSDMRLALDRRLAESILVCHCT